MKLFWDKKCTTGLQLNLEVIITEILRTIYFKQWGSYGAYSSELQGPVVHF